MGWGPNRRRGASAIKGRLRCGKCQSDKQAPLIFLGRLHLDDAGVVVYKGTKLHVPAAKLWKELVMDVHRASHVSPRQTWQEVHAYVVWGWLSSTAHRCKYDRSHGAQVYCIPSVCTVGQDLRNNQTKAGYPKGFRRVYNPFVLPS